jgi:hypothetical protein
MRDILKTNVSRRAVLGAGVAGASLLAMPAVLRAQDKSLKVGVYGGYFKDSFDKNIFADFTKETGIAVESVAEPTGEAWLVQLEQAAKAGQAPADVSMMSQVAMLKGQSTELWTPLSTRRRSRTSQPHRPFRQQVSGWPRRRHRCRRLVHHARHQHRRLQGSADLLDRAVGSGQRRQARPAGARLQLLPAGSDGKDPFRRHQRARHRGRPR